MLKNLFSLALILIFSTSAAFAIEEKAFEFERPEQDVVEKAYVKVQKEVWDEYFQGVSYVLKKQWTPKKAGLKRGYKNSYVRLLISVDSQGNPVSYKVLGNCVPVNDEAFMAYFYEVLKGDFKFEPLPSGYTADYIVFTTEFHFKLYNSSRVQWIPKRYGAALVQIADNTRKYRVQGIEE